MEVKLEEVEEQKQKLTTKVLGTALCLGLSC